MNNVLTALVAGHRPDRLPGGEAGERLIIELERMLFLLQSVAAVGQASLRVLTGVAKGTDEVTAGITERLELPLHLLAPGRPDPLTASQQRAERTVWLGAVDESLYIDEAIAIRDELALSFADLLVVVWDGQSPQGLSGRTVRLAFQAALMMKPVVWLHTDGSVRMLDRTRLDASSLHKLRCPHPEPSWLSDCFTSPLNEPALRQQFAEAVRLILDPSGASKHDIERLSDYRAEVIQHNTPIFAGHLDKAMMALVHLDFAELRKQFQAKIPQPYWGPEKADNVHPTAPMPLIGARFEHSDVEATVSAGRHRDSIWLLYGASATAVFAAVAGAIGLWTGDHSAFWPIVELALIAMIISGVMLAKRQHWHEKWLGHRFIAEQLRYARMCLPLLGVPHPFMEPAWVLEKGCLQLASAELWFVQRTLATEGLPGSADGTAYVASSEKVKAKLANYVSRVVRAQQKYHHDKYHKQHKSHERLEHLSIGLFGATALAVLAHFAIHANWLLICTAFFPALAAAVYGLETKLEISRIAGQSAATECALKDIVAAIEDAETQPGWEGWLRLRQLALEASRIMSDENSQWQQLIRNQKTGLPG